MMFASSYSQLYAGYPVYFLIVCGFYLTFVTAIYNLCSTASAKYDWLFLEPFVYLFTVYMDHTHQVTSEVAGFLYICFFSWTMIRYLHLMRNIVNQITSYMGLRFLLVKDKKNS